MSKVIWLLSPGHDKFTAGKRSLSIPSGPYQPGFVPKIPGVYEWEFNRDMCERIMCAAPEGILVVNIVPEDTKVTIAERVRRANSYRERGYQPILLPVHCNAYGKGGWNQARGVACFTPKRWSPEEDWLARSIADDIKDSTDLPYRRGGVLRANYGELTGSKMPSVYLEIGFMTSHKDMEILAGEHADANRDEIARAIVGVMVEYQERYHG